MRWNIFIHPLSSKVASVVHPTVDQEVAALTPAWSATFFHGDLIMNMFYGYSLPSADSRRAVVSFCWKNVHNTLPIRGLILPSKGKLTTFNMTPMGCLGRKTSTQTKLSSIMLVLEQYGELLLLVPAGLLKLVRSWTYFHEIKMLWYPDFILKHV